METEELDLSQPVFRKKFLSERPHSYRFYQKVHEEERHTNNTDAISQRLRSRQAPPTCMAMHGCRVVVGLAHGSATTG